MKRLDYLLKFRRYMSMSTVERVYEHMRDNIPENEVMAFLSAYDHRKAELVMGQNFDKVPASAWKYIR